jgi:hypothetical protein
MDKLLQIYSIKQISQKTHISPIILEKLQNKQFDKIDRVKLKGFITILENEYPEYDFSEIKESIDSFMQVQPSQKPKKQEKTESNNSSFKLYFIVLLLLIGIGGLVYYMISKQKKETYNIKDNNISVLNIKENIQNNIEVNKTKEIKENEVQTIAPPKEIINKDNNLEKNLVESNVTEVNNSIESNQTKNQLEQNLTLAIIPLEKVWFRVTYLDEGKSKEYLTSHEVDINASDRVFIKFGHGFIKLEYNNQIIEPKTKKITRVIIEDHNMSITTKRVKEFQ